jgi:hypothetical protein
MPVNAALRNEVWKSMLRAEMNGIYWAKMARRSYNRERVCKFFLLATSSTTVAGWKFWETMGPVWKGLSMVSALLAIALPIINWSKDIANQSDLRGKWLQLGAEFSSLWIQIEAAQHTDIELQKIYDTLTSKEAAVTAGETQQGINQKVLKAAFDDVLKTRGLTPAK